MKEHCDDGAQEAMKFAISCQMVNQVWESLEVAHVEAWEDDLLIIVLLPLSSGLGADAETIFEVEVTIGFAEATGLVSMT